MGRAYGPREIMKMKHETLPWDGKWQEVFGNPEKSDTWFISGSSASGKSSFTMQLAKKLCEYGHVLYLSLEEGKGLSFQQRLERFHMEEVQGAFRIIDDGDMERLRERLKKRKSAKFIIVDSFQFAQAYGWEYLNTMDLVKEFPEKSFIFISQEYKSQPMGKPAAKIKYLAGVKVRVVGFKAMCQGRFISEAGAFFPVWEDGIIQSSNNV